MTTEENAVITPSFIITKDQWCQAAVFLGAPALARIASEWRERSLSFFYPREVEVTKGLVPEIIDASAAWESFAISIAGILEAPYAGIELIGSYMKTFGELSEQIKGISESDFLSLDRLRTMMVIGLDASMIGNDFESMLRWELPPGGPLEISPDQKERLIELTAVMTTRCATVRAKLHAAEEAILLAMPHSDRVRQRAEISWRSDAARLPHDDLVHVASIWRRRYLSLISYRDATITKENFPEARVANDAWTELLLSLIHLFDFTDSDAAVPVSDRVRTYRLRISQLSKDCETEAIAADAKDFWSERRLREMQEFIYGVKDALSEAKEAIIGEDSFYVGKSLALLDAAIVACSKAQKYLSMAETSLLQVVPGRTRFRTFDVRNSGGSVETWALMPVEVGVHPGTGRFVVLGTPADFDEANHSCDRNGCMSDHVLARGRLLDIPKQDELASFISSYCTTGADRQAQSSLVYDAYRRWCVMGGEKPMAQRRFTQALAERGITSKRMPEYSLYIGIGLLDTAHNSSETPSNADGEPQSDDVALRTLAETMIEVLKLCDLADMGPPSPSGKRMGGNGSVTTAELRALLGNATVYPEESVAESEDSETKWARECKEVRERHSEDVKIETIA